MFLSSSQNGNAKLIDRGFIPHCILIWGKCLSTHPDAFLFVFNVCFLFPTVWFNLVFCLYPLYRVAGMNTCSYIVTNICVYMAHTLFCKNTNKIPIIGLSVEKNFMQT